MLELWTVVLNKFDYSLFTATLTEDSKGKLSNPLEKFAVKEALTGFYEAVEKIWSDCLLPFLSFSQVILYER